MKKTIVYIDGFNLYYSLKSTSFKWLNLQKFSATHLNPKQHNIVKIKYFTARVQSTSDADLTPPLLHIKHRLKKLVIVISPYKKISAKLKKSCHFYKAVSPEVLEQCQFPQKMRDDKGEFFCPPKWKQAEQ